MVRLCDLPRADTAVADLSVLSAALWDRVQLSPDERRAGAHLVHRPGLALVVRRRGLSDAQLVGRAQTPDGLRCPSPGETSEPSWPRRWSSFRPPLPTVA